MDIFNHKFKHLNNSNSENKILGPVIAILLILFAVFMAPKLPKSATHLMNNNVFKVIFIIIIILLAKKHLAVSLISLIIFFIIINNHQSENHKKTVRFSNNTPINTLINTPINNTPINNVKSTSFPDLHPLVNGITIPDISISVASSNVLSDDVRKTTIISSALPITPNITPTASNIIVNSNNVSDNIISNIKNNKSKYINDITATEKKLRHDASKNTDVNVSQNLINDADKLASARIAITSIMNDKDVDTNHELLKSLVKADILKNASINASKNGDKITSNQLDQASLSNANMANSLIQCKILKTKNKNISDSHLNASLNMINYNNNMELSLDAFNKGNYDQSKKYHDLANTYLENNITLNDHIKGITSEDSNKLYEQVEQTNSNCNDVPNITGIDNYEYANF